jgi:1-acyl-sn-glycerol-3-phosphate acyltransferase
MANIISHRVREVGAIPVNRVGYVKRMFESVEKNLKIGKLVCIFPEGGTGLAGKLKKFKKGLAKVVYDLHQEGYHKIPVFPAAIKGTEKFYFPNRKLSLTLGYPLHIDDYMMHSQQETLVQFTEQLWRSVHDLLFENKSND